jgi:hypothetical protein
LVTATENFGQKVGGHECETANTTKPMARQPKSLN